MRPRGEVRQALLEALRVLGRAHYRALAERARVGFEAARRALDNMRRSGDVVPVGSARLPGVCKPLVVYALGTVQGLANSAQAGAVARVSAVLGWWAAVPLPAGPGPGGVA